MHKITSIAYVLMCLGASLLFSACSVMPIHINVEEGKAPTFKEAKDAKFSSRYTQVSKDKWEGKNHVLINGSPVDRDKYPWVLWIRSGGAMCTASLVGPQVVLTAAHCVGDGEAITFKHDGGSYSGVCTHHPQYSSHDHDIAICKLTSKPGIKSIQMHLNPSARMDMKIQIFGFGCVNPGGGGGNDGILRAGFSRIKGAIGRDLYSRATGADNSALCFGDSGGPVLSPEGKQLAVNSKGDIKEKNWTARLDRFAKDWILGWAKDIGAEVCHEDNPCDSKPDPETFYFIDEGKIEISGKFWPSQKTTSKRAYQNTKSRVYSGY